MATIYMMCGLPGSGKSTIAEQISNKMIGRVPIINPDSIRKELYGAESIQGDWDEIWFRAKNWITAFLSYNADVIYDATNITRERRMNFMKEFKSFHPDYICLYVNPGLQECVKRNDKRDRIVPTGVIKRMDRRFEEPNLDEGFKAVVEIKN